MRVLCAGPEASGTRLLARTVATGAEAVHRSMPYGADWWMPEDQEYDRAVVIVRNRQITAGSAVEAGHARNVQTALERRDRAISVLARLDSALWTSYESLLADPDAWLSTLSGWLGVELEFGEPVVDGNEKWRVP